MFKVATADGQHLDEVTVKRKQLSGTQDVDFDAEHAEYQLLSNMVELHQTEAKQQDPQLIDVATVCKVLDSDSDTVSCVVMQDRFVPRISA